MRIVRYLASAFLLLSVPFSGPLPAQTKPYRGAEYRTIASMTYGRFEVRMKTANTFGMLGSFFTYNDLYPSSPWNEIDIEILGKDVDTVQYNVITNAGNHNFHRQVAYNPHAGFHVYSIEWTPYYVRWTIDGYESYRQNDQNRWIPGVSYAQKLMMNIWPSMWADWTGVINPSVLPAYVYYDWIKYYSWTPGVNDNFTLQWTDDLDYFNTNRWQKASHTWDGNLSQFTPSNAVVRDGFLVLCLTDSAHLGYNGPTVTDVDTVPPYVAEAWAYDKTVRLSFGKLLDPVTAQNPANYSVQGGAPVTTATLSADQRAVFLTVPTLSLGSPFTATIQNVKDQAAVANPMKSQTINVALPLAMPIFIDVGGASAQYPYLADDIWSGEKQYGGISGQVKTFSNLSVNGTNAPAVVYQTALDSLYSYAVRVPNGALDVTLMMAENTVSMFKPGARVFGVVINGVTVLDSVDIFKSVGGFTAFEPTLRVNVTDNIINIQFKLIAGRPTLSGLKVSYPTTAIQSAQSTLPAMGFEIYPNPFNPTTNFRFSLPSASPVEFLVFNLLGGEVDHRKLGVLEAGTHSLPWDGSRFASGVYFCTMRAGERMLTKKIVLLK